MEKQPAFHLAFLVSDLEEAADFYCGVIGGRRGRDAPNWIDIDLHGHQLSLHKGDNLTPIQGYSEVDGHPVPMPHFGVVLDFATWEQLVESGFTSTTGRFCLNPVSYTHLTLPTTDRV